MYATRCGEYSDGDYTQSDSGRSYTIFSTLNNHLPQCDTDIGGVSHGGHTHSSGT